MLAVIIIVILMILFWNYKKHEVAHLTDLWLRSVVNKDIEKLHFCKNSILWGTVSQVPRTGKDIDKYFMYFSNLPGLRVAGKHYDIRKIGPDLHINNAIVDWEWRENGEYIRTKARMSFLFNGKCIQFLHSSTMPELNSDLVNSSGRK